MSSFTFPLFFPNFTAFQFSILLTCWRTWPASPLFSERFFLFSLSLSGSHGRRHLSRFFAAAALHRTGALSRWNSRAVYERHFWCLPKHMKWFGAGLQHSGRELGDSGGSTISCADPGLLACESHVWVSFSIFGYLFVFSFVICFAKDYAGTKLYYCYRWHFCLLCYRGISATVIFGCTLVARKARAGRKKDSSH